MLDHGKVYKYLERYCGDFYNPKHALTYNRPVIVCCGSRSIGKSTGWAIFAILEFLEYGRKWIYTRRTKDETELTAPSFFSNAVQIINSFGDFQIEDIKYKAGGYKITVDGEEKDCGYTIPLSLEHKYKSSNLSDAFTIIYDEFIAKFQTDYLGSDKTPNKEYVKLLSLLQTVDRGIGKVYRNETQIVCLGNTATIYNPILIELGIPEYVTQSSKTIAPKGKLWVLERLSEVKATEGIRESYSYQLANEAERDYAYNNINADDFDDSFIGRPSRSGSYMFTVKLDGISYGVSSDGEALYIGKPRQDITAMFYSMDVKSHGGKYDLGLLSRMGSMPHIRLVRDKYNEGKLFFESIKDMKIWIIALGYSRA